MPSRASRAKISEFAERQREHTGLRNGFDLPELVKQNQGTLSYIDFFDEDQTDAIVVEPDGSFCIRLSSHTSALRNNFTIAHELGHLLLHWPLVQKSKLGSGMRATRRVDLSNELLLRCEWEANLFASAFLMPRGPFKKAHNEGYAAEEFGVTQSAARVRAADLGMA